jgi:hypothetical protein
VLKQHLVRIKKLRAVLHKNNPVPLRTLAPVHKPVPITQDGLNTIKKRKLRTGNLKRTRKRRRKNKEKERRKKKRKYLAAIESR